MPRLLCLAVGTLTVVMAVSPGSSAEGRLVTHPTRLAPSPNFVPLANYGWNMDFGLPEDALNRAIDRVCVAVWKQVRHIPGQQYPHVAKRIKDAADLVLREDAARLTDPGRKLIYFEAVNAFVRANVQYGGPVIGKRSDPEGFGRTSTPFYSWVMRDLEPAASKTDNAFSRRRYISAANEFLQASTLRGGVLTLQLPCMHPGG